MPASAVLSNFSKNNNNLIQWFKQLLYFREIDELIVIVRQQESKESILNVKKEAEVNPNLHVKVVVDKNSPAVPLKYIKELKNDQIYIISDCLYFDIKVLDSMYEAIKADDQIGFIFTCLKNNKQVIELNSNETVNYYICHGELPETLDCYNVVIVRKNIVLKLPYQYSSSYSFSHLCKITENEKFKFHDISNVRVKVERKESLYKLYANTRIRDFFKANSYSLTKEPKLSLLEKIFSIKYSNSRYYLCFFSFVIHLKVKSKVKFPKNAFEYSYLKDKINCSQINKVCIFAGFTANGEITQNNKHYLATLKEIFDFIIYVADSNATQQTIECLKNYCDALIIKRHHEYDFGSYKLGFHFLRDAGILKNAQKLLLCNDSVDFIGNFNDLNQIVNLANNYEAYSLCMSNYGFGKKLKRNKYSWVKFPHLQSYFLYLDNKVFNSNYFEQFIESVTKLHNKTEIIIKYEMGLTRLFNNHNVNYSSFYPYDETSVVNPYYLYLNPANKDAIFVKHLLQK